MHHGAESTRCGQIDVAKRATDLKSKWRRENGLTRGTGGEGRSSAICHALACLFSKRQLSSRDRPTGAPSLQLIYVWGLALVCRHLVKVFCSQVSVHFKCVPKAALKLFCKSKLSSEMPCPTCSGYACKNTENGAAAAPKKDCHYAQQVVYHSGVISAPATSERGTARARARQLSQKSSMTD